MRPLTTDFAEIEKRPYFVWDEDLSVAEFRERIRGPNAEERLRLVAKLLREARDTDVWYFLSPRDVAKLLPAVSHQLGKRRAFWEFLMEGWRADGLIASP